MYDIFKKILTAGSTTIILKHFSFGFLKYIMFPYKHRRRQYIYVYMIVINRFCSKMFQLFLFTLMYF